MKALSCPQLAYFLSSNWATSKSWRQAKGSCRCPHFSCHCDKVVEWMKMATRQAFLSPVWTRLKGERKPFYYDFFFKKIPTLRISFLQIGAIHGIRTHWSTFSHVLFHFQVEENMEIVRNFEMSENSNFFSKQDRLAEQSSQTTNPPWVKIIFPSRGKADATNAPIWFSMHRIFRLRIANLYESLIKKC